MDKNELLQNAIAQGNEYGFLSWDGILDLCDEDNKLVNWLTKKLEGMSGELSFELDF